MKKLEEHFSQVPHFGTKFAKKKKNDGKDFEKINVKVKISLYSVPLNQFYLIWQTSDFVGPSFSKENMNNKILKK